MPKIDLDSIPQKNSTGYPPPFDADVQDRWKCPLAPLTGLTALGATHAVLRPGAWSSQRHWHRGEDELLVMLSGEAVLIEDGGRTPLKAGDICVWAGGVENGHHLVNESDADCSYICVSAGDRTAGGSYPDIDMIFTADAYLHKDGTPYPTERIP